MGKFIFKLQPLLNVKKQMEDNLKNELGKSIQKLEKEKDRLKKIEKESEDVIFKINSEVCKGIFVCKLKEYGSYVGYLKEKAELQKENINYAQTVVDKYREQLIAVVKEREMLEKLREKKCKEYNEEQLKIEQMLIDEINSYKYNKTIIGEQNGQK